MNTAMQLSLAAMSASAARNALQVPLDADSTQDLHAVWKSVFDRARAVAASDDGASPSAGDWRELNAIQQVAAAPLASGAWIDAITNVEPEPSPASRPPMTAMQPTAAESINVFVQAAAVAIVVRDVSLSAEEALHCAFATARELTGQRAALQQLTLNGRTIYQQHGDSDVRGRTHGLWRLTI